ncbi:MAG TPA: FAD-binding oxidoreductase [Rhizomicrobium sp.]|jgi:4-cresol dehydrogenase (hydroxylating)
MKVPPGVSAKQFESAIAAFTAVVGAEWVFTSDDDLEPYRDAYSILWGEPEEKIASAAVAPLNVEQVQTVVRIANSNRIPLYPISTGKNLGYGGAAPVLSGSVVLDLKRMNRILEVDERNAYAVVEPGVTYFDLYRYIQDRELNLWIDCPDPGWGSLIGNALDYGGGYTHSSYRNHFESHCGMEVVLANGDLLRTGMGALPGAKTWQQNKYGYGPWLDGLFKQSSLGVVTKMGFWLYPAPEAYLSGIIGVPKKADIGPLVDVINYLENTVTMQGMPVFSCSFLPLGFAAPPPPGMPGYDAPVVEQEDYTAAHSLPFWTVTVSYYGAAEVVKAQWEYTKRKASAIPGATFSGGEVIAMPPKPETLKGPLAKSPFGIPALSIFSIGARSEQFDPTDGHITCSPIIPRTGEDIVAAYDLIQKTVKRLDLPVMILTPPIGCWARTFVILIMMATTHEPEKNMRTRASFRELIRILAEHGYGEYRTAAAFQDDVMATYSFNNHALLRFHEAIKDAVDPNGILSAGRYGVWPRHLRKVGR